VLESLLLVLLDLPTLCDRFLDQRLPFGGRVGLGVLVFLEASLEFPLNLRGDNITLH